MIKLNKNTPQENKLYNNVLFLSRNELLYTTFNLSDTFQNRINLIFIHFSFLFIKLRHLKSNEKYKVFNQNMFDLIFGKIESNMRELGYGDVAVNKNMKFLVKVFYSILLYCETYSQKKNLSKNSFLNKYLTLNNDLKTDNYNALIKYFDKFHSFCIDLSFDRVLKGELNFNYK